MAILKIANEARDYAWGDLTLIPELMGQEPTGKPQAEVWFGTHPASPSQVLDSESGTLTERVGELGFLVKFLAAARPLSIQAHPTKAHAAARFAEGYPGYADANHKPELIVAVTDFRALCGFRPVAEIAEDLSRLAQGSDLFAPWLAQFGAAGIEGAARWALSADPQLAAELVKHAAVLGERGRLIETIHAHAGDDVGVLVSLLMNYVELAPGEGLFLPAGNIHSYLLGLGVEVMAASDNVLRGGLTPKPIDIPELISVVKFEELREPKVAQRELLRGLTEYQVAVDDFRVYRVEPSGSNLLIDLNLKGQAILVCVAGEITLSISTDESVSLRRGEACYFDSANFFSILGSGTGYLTMG